MSYIFATNKMHRSELTITKWFVLVTEINKNKNTSYKTVVCSSRKTSDVSNETEIRESVTHSK